MSYYPAGYANAATQTTLVGAHTIEVEDATTNAASTVLTLLHRTTGTPASGLASRLLFQAEDSAGNAQNAAAVDGALTTVTDGSEVGALIFSSWASGALLEGLRVGGATAAVVVNSTQSGSVDFTVAGQTNASMIAVDADVDLMGLGAAAAAASRLRVAFPTLAIAASVTGSYVIVNPALTEAGSGTHAAMVGVDIVGLSLTAGVADTTDAATLRVQGAPSGATANWSFWVDAGDTRLDGSLLVGTTTAPAVGGSYAQTQTVATSGSPTAFLLTGAAHTTLAAGAEAVDVNFNLARTVQFTAGAITTQRAFVVQAPTYAMSGAGNLITTAATVDITGGPSTGTGGGITTSAALRVGASGTSLAIAASAIYRAIDVPSQTLTYTGTGSNVTGATPALLGLGTLTITESDAARTVTNAATLYIAGAPTAGANITITNAFALWVDAGAARFDGNIGFFSTAPAAQQTSGANLTNNVTSGGTDDTVDNWTSLNNYATDAAAIRNAVYQLARKLKQVNDGLRTFGLFT